MLLEMPEDDLDQQIMELAEQATPSKPQHLIEVLASEPDLGKDSFEGEHPNNLYEGLRMIIRSYLWDQMNSDVSTLRGAREAEEDESLEL